MAIRVDGGEVQVNYLPNGQPAPKKKKKKKPATLPNGAPVPTIAPKPQAPSPSSPGRITSLAPLQKIMNNGGQLDSRDVSYLQQLAWTTKNDDTSDDLRQAIDAARLFFEENPKISAGLDYNAFHKEGKVRHSAWYKKALARADMERFEKSPQGKQMLRHRQSDKGTEMPTVVSGMGLSQPNADSAFLASMGPQGDEAGGDLPADAKLKMMNKAWKDVFSGTKVGRMPLDLQPAFLALDSVDTEDKARAMFTALRDPYLLDLRNPYAMNIEEFASFYTELDQDLEDLRDKEVDPIDRMATSGDVSPLVGTITPRAGERVRTVSGEILGLKSEDTIRLGGLLTSAIKEYAALASDMKKAGSLLTQKQMMLGGQHPVTNVLQMLQAWAAETNPSIKVDGKTWTPEMDEAIKSKQFSSALWRSVASEGKDAEAELYLQTEWGFSAIDGKSDAEAFLDQYLQPPVVPDQNTPEWEALTQEDRDFLLAEVQKTPEQRKADLMTRLAVESKLPYEQDASAVYKLYRENPELVTDEYKAVFERAKVKVEETYDVHFGEGLETHVVQGRTGKGGGAVGEKKRPLLTKASQEAVVYAALNVASIDLYAEAAQAQADAEAQARPTSGKGKVGLDASERGVVGTGVMGAFGDTVNQWNRFVHHPAATLLETGQVETAQKISSGDTKFGGKGGGASMVGGSGTPGEKKQAALEDYAEYLTMQRLANPSQKDEDFGSYWAMASWSWQNLKDRNDGRYMNFGLYAMQEADPNYKSGDSMVAEFLIDTVFEAVVLAPVASGMEASKIAITGTKAYKASRGVLLTKLGQETVADLGARIVKPSTFVQMWGVDPQTAARMAASRTRKEFTDIALEAGIDPRKLDPGAWAMPMKMKLGLQNAARSHPHLERITRIVGKQNIGDSVPNNVAAIEDIYERALAKGLNGHEASELADEATRILAGTSDGSEVFLRKFSKEWNDIIDEGSTRVTKRATQDAKGGKRIKESARQRRRSRIEQALDGLHRQAQKLDDEVDVLRRAKGRTKAEESMRLAKLSKAEDQLTDLMVRIRQHEMHRMNTGGKWGRRPVTRDIKRDPTEAEKIVGHRIYTPYEQANINTNLRAFQEDVGELLQERNRWIPSNDDAYVRKFAKQDKEAYWEEMRRTAAREARDPEGNLDESMLTDEFIRKNGFISDQRLEEWFDDRVRPEPKGKEAKRIEAHATGQRYGVKQGSGLETAERTDLVTGPHEAVQIARARLAILRELRTRRQELRKIAPRLAGNEERLTREFIAAGANATKAGIEAQRLIIRQIADNVPGLDTAALRQLDNASVEELGRLALQMDVGEDVVAGWTKNWQKLMDGIDSPKIDAAVGGDLKVLQRQVRSNRAKRETADMFVHYGQMSTKDLQDDLGKMTKALDDLKRNGGQPLTREEFLAQRPALPGVHYYGSPYGDIDTPGLVPKSDRYSPFGRYTTQDHTRATEYARGRSVGGNAPEGRLNYVEWTGPNPPRVLDLGADFDEDFWMRVVNHLHATGITSEDFDSIFARGITDNESAFHRIAHSYGDDTRWLQDILEDPDGKFAFDAYKKVDDPHTNPHEVMAWSRRSTETNMRVLAPDEAFERYLEPFERMRGAVGRNEKKLKVMQKILEQRSAESSAIKGLRAEIADLQRITADFEHIGPGAIERGSISPAALGSYSPTGQPLLPSQMQEFYHPTFDTRLAMTWRLGKTARRMEVMNTKPLIGGVSLDKASNVFKTVILARLATAIRIVLGDEATRFIPEGIDPIAAQHYIKELLEYEKVAGKVVIPPDLHVGLSRLYGVIRRTNYAMLDPGDPEFLTAYRGMLRQWNADPMVRKWVRIYKKNGGGESGQAAALEWLRGAAAAQKENLVNTHLKLTNRMWPNNATMKQIYGAMGSDDFMAGLRNSFEGQNIDDWIEAVQGQFTYFAENKWTKDHFLHGVKPQSADFKGAGANFSSSGTDLNEVLPMVLGRLESGDIGQGHHMLDPRTLFGSTLEGISGRFTEMTYAHFYMQERTRLLAHYLGVAGKQADPTDIWNMGKHLPKEVIEEAEAKAMVFGRNQVQRVMYTAGTSASEDLLRNIILFLPAQRQYIAYWAKAIFQHPWLLAYFHRLDQTPDYLEFRMPWQDENETSKLFLRGFLFATPGFREDTPGSKLYSMIPGLGLPGVIAGAAAGTATLAGINQPQEFMMKMPGGDFYKDTYRPLNTSLTQFAYGIGTLIANKPWQPLPEQIAGSNAKNLWKFSEALKAQMSRTLMSGDLSDENLPKMEGWNSVARQHGLKALLTAGWNFVVPMKLSIVDTDAQQYLDTEMEWEEQATYQDRLDYIAEQKAAFPLWYRVKELELASSPEDRQRIMYKHPEVIPYYITNISSVRPEGEEFDFEDIVTNSKTTFLSRLRTQEMVGIQEEIEKEEKWFKKVYLPAMRRNEAWTGSNTSMLTGASAASTPDSPSNVMRVKEEFEKGEGQWAQGKGIKDPKTGKWHFGLGPMREKLTSAAYLSSSDFASSTDSDIYKATEELFNLRAGARFVRTSKAYSDFADLYNLSHKEGEEEVIISALKPFTQMTETELAAVFGKKWKGDEEWIRQRVASVWEQYTDAYKAWTSKVDKHGKKPNQGKDYGDFRNTDLGEAWYAAVTKEVYTMLAGPNRSEVLSGGVARQLMNTPLVRPHFVLFEKPDAPKDPNDPMTRTEQILDEQAGMFSQPGPGGMPLSKMPLTLPSSDEAGKRKVSFGEKVMPERLVAGILADAAMRLRASRQGDQIDFTWSKKDVATLNAEAAYLKTYMKTADPVMKYNIREMQRAAAWKMLLVRMDNLSTAAWGVPSEYQADNSYYKGRSYSEKLSQSLIKQTKKKWLPILFELSPLFKEEFEYYNKKADGNIMWDMLNTYR